MGVKGIILLSAVSVLLTGCTKILYPYEESKACIRGYDAGLCGRVSDVYTFYDRGGSLKKLTEEHGKRKAKEASDEEGYDF